MSSTRSLRSANPPSAAKNGTWVVPAWVMSGPSPETAALRMRSNWTSQPTSSTLTLTPVFAVNGAISLSRSSFGLGELGIVQSVRVTPFWSWLAWLVGLLLLVLELSPPQAATAVASPSATAAAAASLERTIFLLLDGWYWAKTFLVLRLRNGDGSLGQRRDLLRGGS